MFLALSFPVMGPGAWCGRKCFKVPGPRLCWGGLSVGSGVSHLQLLLGADSVTPQGGSSEL